MWIMSMTIIDRIVDFMCNIKSPVLAICYVVGIFMGILVIQDKPYMLIGLFATRKFKPAKKQHKYAVLIPARNEEPVIANLINSIRKQDYPQELITMIIQQRWQEKREPYAMSILILKREPKDLPLSIFLNKYKEIMA